MLRYLAESSAGFRSFHRVKPGLLFLLKLAWDSRARLPLLLMSGFLALGIRVRLEINIDRSIRFLPRLRLDEGDLGELEEEDSEGWTSEEGMDTTDEGDYYDDDEYLDQEETDEENDVATTEKQEI